MKPYIIAAALFVTAFLILGVLTANVMAPPEPAPQAHVPPPNQRPSGGGMPGTSGEATSTDPAAQTYPAVMPSARPAAAPPSPGAPPLVPGMPGPSNAGMPGMPPGSGTAPGTSNPMNVSAPAAIPMPRPSSIEPTSSVPIIQPTDVGTPTTPTAAKAHQ
jgi:hypothetical protein